MFYYERYYNNGTDYNCLTIKNIKEKFQAIQLCTDNRYSIQEYKIYIVVDDITYTICDIDDIEEAKQMKQEISELIEIELNADAL